MNDHKLVPIEIQTEDEGKKDAEGAKDSKTNGEIDTQMSAKVFEKFQCPRAMGYLYYTCHSLMPIRQHLPPRLNLEFGSSPS